MTGKLYSYVRSFYAVVKQIKLGGLILALTSNAEFAQLIRPIGQRPLILSAHPGDAVMAIGGLLAWYGKLDIPVTVATVTAGLHGTNTGRLNRALGPRRQQEEINSYRALDGDIKPIFLGLDEKFTIDDDFMLKILEIIDELNPDIIYTPSLLDNHPDNQTLSCALGSILQRLPSVRLKASTVAQYELWSPLVPNKIISIDNFVANKRSAITCHETQLICRNYLDAMMGLNRYRAAMLGAGNHAEALFVCSAHQYINFASLGGTPVMEMVA